MKIVNYDGVNTHSVSAGPKAFVRLVPGRNEIEDAVFDKLMAKKNGSEGFQHLCNENIVTIIDDKAVSDDGELIISQVAVKDAKSIIEGEIDIDTLNGYLEEENTAEKPRPSILKAITEQIEKLSSD